jgi:predicted outer membrane repeat protein
MRRNIKIKTCLVTWLILLTLCVTAIASGKIIYVDATIRNANFMSLTKSNVQYPHIQAAIDAAVDSDTIILTPGTFRGDGNRDIDFKGKAIALRSIDPNNPNIVAATIIDCNGSEAEPHRGFYFHNGEDANSILEGLTITNGFHSNGAGICCTASSPIIRKNIIMNNKIEFDATGGAGIACWEGASPTIINNIIKQNVCYPGGGGGGILCCRADSPIISNNIISANIPSGIDIDDCSPVVSNCKITGNIGGIITGKVNVETSPTIYNCTITGNSTTDGGGMYNYYTNPIIIDCNFIANCATGYEEGWGGFGGGMFNYHSSPTITNCTFSGNSAKHYGGAIHNWSSSPTLTNCTIADNNAPNGPAMACDTYEQLYPSTVKMVNSIIWNRFPWLWNNDHSTINVTYSDVQGGWPDVGNIDADPCFADAAKGDYHLKSQAGRWDPVNEFWVKDEVTSLCIDAGEPDSPIGYEPFPNGGIINMGAYGGTSEASKSYFGEPLCETIVAGDINGDCKVNFFDLALMADHWLERHSP